jgi:hypothetical protein
MGGYQEKKEYMFWLGQGMRVSDQGGKSKDVLDLLDENIHKK